MSLLASYLQCSLLEHEQGAHARARKRSCLATAGQRPPVICQEDLIHDLGFLESSMGMRSSRSTLVDTARLVQGIWALCSAPCWRPRERCLSGWCGLSFHINICNMYPVADTKHATRLAQTRNQVSQTAAAAAAAASVHTALTHMVHVQSTTRIRQNTAETAMCLWPRGQPESVRGSASGATQLTLQNLNVSRVQDTQLASWQN